MMKKLVLFYSLLVTELIVHGQHKHNATQIQLPLVKNLVVYTGTVSTDTSLSKEQLFDHAQQWYRHNFESADNTFLINNKEIGLIKGTGIIHARRYEKEDDPGDLFFNVAIAADKGSYRYTIDSIYGFNKTNKYYYSDIYNEELYPPARPAWPKTYREAALRYMNERITTMIAAMQTDMARR